VPVDDVAALLQRWREAGGVWSRARVLTEGARLLSGLTPDERRQVASALADHGAPDLAERLGAASGTTLDAEQVRSVAGGLLELDGDQVDELVSALQDPEQRRAAVDEAWRHLPPPPHADGPETSLPPPSEALADLRVHHAADAAGLEGLHAIARGEIPLDDVELGDQVLDHPGLDVPDLVMPGVHEVELTTGAPMAAGASASAASGVAAPGDDDATHYGTTDDRDAGDRDDALHDAAGTSAAAAGATAPASREPATTDEPASPTATTVPAAESVAAIDVAQVLRRLRSASTARARTAALADLEDAHLDTDGAVRVLDAVPDGWQRRRAAQRLVAAGALDAVPAAVLLQRLARPGDRTFLAGTLLDVGVAEDEVVAALPDLVARRLRVRSARNGGG
jgi:hypothetical protein